MKFLGRIMPRSEAPPNIDMVIPKVMGNIKGVRSFSDRNRGEADSPSAIEPSPKMASLSGVLVVR